MFSSIMFSFVDFSASQKQTILNEVIKWHRASWATCFKMFASCRFNLQFLSPVGEALNVGEKRLRLLLNSSSKLTRQCVMSSNVWNNMQLLNCWLIECKCISLRKLNFHVDRHHLMVLLVAQVELGEYLIINNEAHHPKPPFDVHISVFSSLIILCTKSKCQDL